MIDEQEAGVAFFDHLPPAISWIEGTFPEAEMRPGCEDLGIGPAWTYCLTPTVLVSLRPVASILRRGWWVRVSLVIGGQSAKIRGAALHPLLPRDEFDAWLIGQINNQPQQNDLDLLTLEQKMNDLRKESLLIRVAQGLLENK